MIVFTLLVDSVPRQLRGGEPIISLSAKIYLIQICIVSMLLSIYGFFVSRMSWLLYNPTTTFFRQNIFLKTDYDT